MRHNSSIWHNVRYVPAQGMSIEEMDNARKLPTDKVRAEAEKQLKRVKELFEDSAKVSWFEGPVMVYYHWKPWKEVIDNAEENFKNGEKESDPDRKKEYYLMSWRTGRIAVDKIAEEAKKDRTLFSIYAEKAVEKVVTPIVEKGKEIAKEAQKKIEETSNTVLYITLGLGAAYILVRAFESKR